MIICGTESQKWCHTGLRNLNLTCVGPTSGNRDQGNILQPCPGKITLDFDTARLHKEKSRFPYLVLDSRCVRCWS